MNANENQPHFASWMLTFCALLTLVFGSYGYSVYFETLGYDNKTLLDTVYAAFGLFFFDFHHENAEIPLSLEVARWLGLITIGGAVIKAFSLILNQQFNTLRAKSLKQHAIIFGSSSLIDQLIPQFKARNIKVVSFVSNEVLNSNTAKQAGRIRLIHTSSLRNDLLNAGLKKASYLLAATDDDARNIEIINKARDLDKDRGRGLLSCSAKIENSELAASLYDHPSVFTDYSHFSAKILDIFRIAARKIVCFHGPDTLLPMREKTSVSILIVGDHPFAQQLALQFGRLGHYGEVTLNLCIAGPNAAEQHRGLLQNFPMLADIVNIASHAVPASLNNTCATKVLLEKAQADLIYVTCRQNTDALIWQRALTQQSAATPMLICKMEGRFSDSLFESVNTHAQTELYDLFQDVCRFETVFGDMMDSVAIAIHNNYVKLQLARGATPETNSSLVEWQKLPESLKDANRAQADHLWIKWRLIAGDKPFIKGSIRHNLNDTLIEMLALTEHNRWVAEKRLSGWLATTGPKDPVRKISPLLIPWAELSESEREKDRDAARQIPDLLAGLSGSVIQ